MRKDNAIEFVQLGEFKDQLTEILKQDARNLIVQVVEAEFTSFLQSHEDERLEDGRKRVVRHGHLPEWKVMTGIGLLLLEFLGHEIVKQRIKNRLFVFTLKFCPPYVRRSKSIEQAIPYLYLKGVSSGDFSQVMPMLLGKDAAGFSADTVLRLRHKWKEELL